MATISDALVALGITEWKLDGEPTSAEEFASTFKKITGTDASGQVVYTSDASDFGVTWADVSAKLTELNAAEPLKFLRAERNRKIAETDWWVLPDRTATAEQTAYRQALRDITDTYSSLDTVVWPTKPE
jgi:hypothetical protein